MSTAAEIRGEFVAGREFSVTNHYITREDHPCFGTRRVSVERVNSASVHLAPGGRVEWPRVSQMSRDADGVVRFYGGGIGQAPDELFLTFEPITDEEDEDELETTEEARGLRHGQARYLVRKIQRGRTREAYSIRCPDDTFVVYSYEAPRPVARV